MGVMACERREPTASRSGCQPAAPAPSPPPGERLHSGGRPEGDRVTATPDARSRERDQALSSVDYAWLRMDDPTNLMLINGVLVLARPLSFPRLRETVERRLVPISRFRQRVVPEASGGRPRWENDPAFDLDRHVLAMTLPGAGGDAELRAVVSELVSEPLDPARPLWEFRLIDNYLGGAVLFGRIHHCVGDGMALMLVLLSLTDRDEEASTGGEAAHLNPFIQLFGHEPPDMAAVRAAADQVMPDGIRLMLQPAEAYRKARWQTALASIGALARLVLRLRDPKTIFKGPLGVPKRAGWSNQIPLADVKAVGQALGGTVNDVLLTAMAGGLRRYLLARGESAERLSFRAAMPVNLRSLGEMANLGNRFGLIFLSIPVGIADPVARLAELKRLSKKLRVSAEPVVVFAILRLLGLVPHFVQKLVVSIFATKTTAVMTNVPGPRETLYLAGVPITDVFFWVPQSGRVGLGISICSYD